MCTSSESLCCIPETNIMLYINYTSIKNVRHLKRQASEWEKIFANEATDKGLISKIYKQLIQLNIKETNTPIQK